MMMMRRTAACLRLVRPPAPPRARAYHYDADIYGYRTPKPPPFEDYTPEELENRIRNANLLRLVYAFRTQGHRMANLDPLNLTPTEDVLELDPARYGIRPTGDSYNLAGIVHIGKTSDPSISRDRASIETILKHLTSSYCGHIGFEFAHIPVKAERRWMAQLVESYEKHNFSQKEKKQFASLLTKSEMFDHFMAQKFPQVKRYGLQGAESMMIAMYMLFREASMAGIRDIICCMPHRGRLNLLTDLLKYPPAALFHKVKGKSEFPEKLGLNGDVFSHLAISSDIDADGTRPVHVSMIHNPSHLEAANPVALGKARARQMYLFEAGNEVDCSIGDRVMCVQLHGDSAFTGQGVVTETLGLSNLPHFSAGGSIHLIVNNQIGYTTPAMNARSTVYTSDVGKMINCPVIHVNADFPEDVATATAIAFGYRNKFRKDVIIDLMSYRRLGHNELDEPAYTQPKMYEKIRSLKSVPGKYEEALISQGVFKDRAEVDEVRARYYGELEKHLEASASYQPEIEAFKGKWSKMRLPEAEGEKRPSTGVDVATLKRVGSASVATPSGFKVHSRIGKYHIESRVAKMREESGKVDWATAEALAMGTLLLEGHHVRISGQDVGRGTFSQRHAMLVDAESERTIIPLNRMDGAPGVRPGKLEIANSNLSEFAVVGFEYGVSLEAPGRLCIWEAQFGDFFNGAQIVIDTCLASGETKWLRQSDLVLLLPHGYDGAGPEHSSARLERFLQMSDAGYDVERGDVDADAQTSVNMHVVYPTTAAQYFHLLRRQMAWPWRRPLVVMAPKLLLRHPQAASEITALATGTRFEPVLADTDAAIDAGRVRRVCFFSGKLFYDLAKERAQRIQQLQDQKHDQDQDRLPNADEIAFVRIEELSPFPATDVRRELQRFTAAREFVWVQEEPQNMGAYSFVAPRIEQLLPAGTSLRYHGRPPAAAPATGVAAHHRKEHEHVVKGIFGSL